MFIRTLRQKMELSHHTEMTQKKNKRYNLTNAFINQNNKTALNNFKKTDIIAEHYPMPSRLQGFDPAVLVDLETAEEKRPPKREANSKEKYIPKKRETDALLNDVDLLEQNAANDTGNMYEVQNPDDWDAFFQTGPAEDENTIPLDDNDNNNDIQNDDEDDGIPNDIQGETIVWGGVAYNV